MPHTPGVVFLKSNWLSGRPSISSSMYSTCYVLFNPPHMCIYLCKCFPCPSLFRLYCPVRTPAYREETAYREAIVFTCIYDKESTCPPEPIPEPFQNLASAAALCPAGFTLPRQNALHCPNRIDVVYGVSAAGWCWKRAKTLYLDQIARFLGCAAAGLALRAAGKKTPILTK